VSTTQTVLTVGYCCAMVRGIPWARPSNVLTEPAGTAAAPGHADKKRRSTLHSGAAAAVEAAGGAHGIVQPGKGKIRISKAQQLVIGRSSCPIARRSIPWITHTCLNG
jgi:hypothetical protein